ncbi:MAG: alanine--tRNA ligase [Aaplasma endosymbiont of Hyalomma asiaticum]
MDKSSLSCVRHAFVDYFVKHGHKSFPSAPLIAEGDASLLFTNAGMVPFKQIFTSSDSDVATAVSSQKCLRAGGKHNDLENVGYTNRHHTFFEMLGNFSFGDYFKDTAIELAWNFVTQELCLSKDRLWITVYSEDQEAFNIWKKVTGFPENRIIRISTDDNFWSMGDTGPCGPCSEIFYDYGENVPGGLPGTDQGEGARFTEIWNLVFMQFFRDEEGTLFPLPRKCIDTGMGLERISAVVQGVCDNYDTDMFKAIIARSQQTFGNPEHSVAHRVIADHIRAASFLIAEGLGPGNEGRNYVLRRIIRRAVRYAYQLNNEKFSIHDVVPVLTRKGSAGYMGDIYPEIAQAEQSIMSTLEQEENGFYDTLRRGTVLLEKEISDLASGDVLRGDVAFKLYDTFGFPLDITLDIAKEKQLLFDAEGFDKCMSQQKERSRKHWVGSGENAMNSLWCELLSRHNSTCFVGYENIRCASSILAIVKNDKIVEQASVGDIVSVLLDISPFYGESGGQEGDKGTITVVRECLEYDNGEESVIEVHNTKKLENRLNIHECFVRSGSIKVGDVVYAVVDEDRRSSLRANHSATHMLHNALRTLVNSEVQQKGSLVAEDKLRFDYSHSSPLTSEQIMLIEQEINKQIVSNKPVFTDNCSYDRAVQQGAIALFGEKYDHNSVRVVSIGDSKELCCGTHVRCTGDIGAFKIISETGISTGVRRIEAITGYRVIDKLRRDGELLNSISESLSAPVTQVVDKLKKLFQEKRELGKKLTDAWYEIIRGKVQTIDIQHGVVLCLGRYTDIPVETIVDYVRDRRKDKTVWVLVSVTAHKAVIVVGVGDGISKILRARDLVNVLRILQGKGGGSDTIARSSISSELVDKAETLVIQHVNDVLRQNNV